MPKVDVNKQMALKLQPFARRTWDVIGMDCEAASNEAGEKLTASLAVESSIESCYMELYGGEGAKEVSAEFSKGIADKTLDYDKIKRYLVREGGWA